MTEEIKEVVEEVKEEVVKEEITYTEDEKRAITLGWKPKEEWQGSEDDWVPAKWWLKYGDVEQRAVSLETETKKKDRVITAMKDHYVRVKEDAKNEVLQTIKRQKQEAVKNEDFQRVAELDAQADEIDHNLNTRFTKRDTDVAKDVNVPAGPPVEFFEWNKINPWYRYGVSTDELTNEADTIAIGFANKNPQAAYGEVLKYTEERIKRMYPDKFEPKPTPGTAVDDGAGRRSGSPAKPSNKTKLDEAQKAAAAEFGMTEEDYYKSMVSWEKRRGM